MEQQPWLKSYDPGLPHTLQPYPEKTLLDVLQETVQQRPNQLASIFKGRYMDYQELNQLSRAFAKALAGLNVRKGDRVLLMLPNSPQAIIAQLGAWMAGAIVCPVNALYTERELEHALNECGAETVVTLSPFYDKVKALQAKTQVKRVIATNIKEFLPPHLRLLFTLVKEKKEGYRVTLQPGDYWMQELLRQHQNTSEAGVVVLPGDPAILLFSGGTTGTAKAVLGSHRSLFISATQLHHYAKAILNDWTDRLTLVMPMFHVYGNMGLCTSLLARWPVVLIPNPRDLDDLVATLRSARPAALHGIPTLFNALLNHPKVKSGKADFSSIKICYSAAAPLLSETKTRFEKLTGGRLLEAYSMTETLLASVICPTQGVYKPGSTGVPLPDVDVRIVDIETAEPRAWGELGEIIVRAPQIMEGYWGHPEETEKILREGWIYTGDIGYMDGDGYLFIIDRKKDLIKPGGFQVWPSEVEEVIASHPAVAEVCVAGVLDPQQGETVKAWVVLNPQSQLDVHELQEFCRQKLARYKVPRFVEFRQNLPKTLVGKILRRVLVSEEAPAS